MKPTTVAGLAGVEVAGAGRPLLFFHGNSADHRSFLGLLTCDALAGRRLVALDLPGHGASPRGGAYTLAGLVAAMAAAAEALDAGVVLGHSLAGHLLLRGCAAGGFAGALGVAVLGTPPIPGPAGMEVAFRPDPAMAFIFQGELSAEERETWLRASFGPAPPPWSRDALEQTDVALRPALLASFLAEPPVDEVAVLSTSPVPVAVLWPTADPFCAPAHMEGLAGRRLWRGRAERLEGLGHYAHWDAPEVVGAVLGAFEAEVGGRAPG